MLAPPGTSTEEELNAVIEKKMNILDACNAQDIGAALIGDGGLVAAAYEERFVREKLGQVFPARTTAYMIKDFIAERK